MIAAGVLDEDDRVEFLHGEVVPKMPQGDPHAFGIEQLNRLLIRLVSDDVSVRCQCPVTIGEDEPEPDFVLCVRPEKRENRHPRAEHTFLIVEIADSSLEFDRTEKMGTYARAGIPVYWIVNLEDRLIEVYTDPAVADSRYGRRTGYGLGQDVPVIVAGVEVGRIEVSAVLR
jgi:Uma2 family endonuclease